MDAARLGRAPKVKDTTVSLTAKVQRLVGRAIETLEAAFIGQPVRVLRGTDPCEIARIVLDDRLVSLLSVECRSVLDVRRPGGCRLSRPRSSRCRCSGRSGTGPAAGSGRTVVPERSRTAATTRGTRRASAILSGLTSAMLLRCDDPASVEYVRGKIGEEFNDYTGHVEKARLSNNRRKTIRRETKRKEEHVFSKSDISSWQPGEGVLVRPNSWAYGRVKQIG